MAFDLHFSDALLAAIFGQAATQHAAPGSYGPYFRARVEQALQAPDAPQNYFLHHVFEGAYRDEHLPPYLREGAVGSVPQFEVVEGTLADVPDLGRFDFVHLSNLFDWMSEEETGDHVRRLRETLRPGARILWRQLNNTRDLTGPFRPSFSFDSATDRHLLGMERAAFYTAVHLGTHR